MVGLEAAVAGFRVPARLRQLDHLSCAFLNVAFGRSLDY